MMLKIFLICFDYLKKLQLWLKHYLKTTFLLLEKIDQIFKISKLQNGDFKPINFFSLYIKDE